MDMAVSLIRNNNNPNFNHFGVYTNCICLNLTMEINNEYKKST